MAEPEDDQGVELISLEGIDEMKTKTYYEEEGNKIFIFKFKGDKFFKTVLPCEGISTEYENSIEKCQNKIIDVFPVSGGNYWISYQNNSVEYVSSDSCRVNLMKAENDSILCASDKYMLLVGKNKNFKIMFIEGGTKKGIRFKELKTDYVITRGYFISGSDKNTCYFMTLCSKNDGIYIYVYDFNLIMKDFLSKGGKIIDLRGIDKKKILAQVQIKKTEELECYCMGQTCTDENFCYDTLYIVLSSGHGKDRRILRSFLKEVENYSSEPNTEIGSPSQSMIGSLTTNVTKTISSNINSNYSPMRSKGKDKMNQSLSQTKTQGGRQSQPSFVRISCEDGTNIEISKFKVCDIQEDPAGMDAIFRCYNRDTKSYSIKYAKLSFDKKKQDSKGQHKAGSPNESPIVLFDKENVAENADILGYYYATVAPDGGYTITSIFDSGMSSVGFANSIEGTDASLYGSCFKRTAPNTEDIRNNITLNPQFQDDSMSIKSILMDSQNPQEKPDKRHVTFKSDDKSCGTFGASPTGPRSKRLDQERDVFSRYESIPDKTPEKREVDIRDSRRQHDGAAPSPGRPGQRAAAQDDAADSLGLSSSEGSSDAPDSFARALESTSAGPE